MSLNSFVTYVLDSYRRRMYRRLKSIPLPLENIAVQKYYDCTKARSGEMTA
jgi:hypothetical protein